jgi:hypothetical protein
MNIEALNVKEMKTHEMKETNGGFFLTLLAAGAIVLLFTFAATALNCGCKDE